MSTLKASRADNYYFPPSYNSVGGSINKFQKSHPLGDRAKKLDQGILVIRYETPFHVKCQKCNNMIGKGVRFNAEKKAIGNYYSTKIWQFTMKCPSCKNKIVCKTDPEKAQYIYTEGAQRILNTENASEGQFIPDREEKEKLLDPFAQLENQVVDIQKAEEKKPEIEKIAQMQKDRFDNDFDINLRMRRKFKDEKKILEQENKPKNVALKLENLSKEEENMVKKTQFKQLSQAKQKMVDDRNKIRAQDIFLHDNKQKKQKIESKNYNSIKPLSKQQQQAREIEKLKMKLSKMPKSTQQALKLQIKQNNQLKFHNSSVQFNKQNNNNTF